MLKVQKYIMKVMNICSTIHPDGLAEIDYMKTVAQCYCMDVPSFRRLKVHKYWRKVFRQRGVWNCYSERSTGESPISGPHHYFSRAYTAKEISQAI